MTQAPSSSDQDFAAELWADVGGTFTDCFLVTHEGRRSLKVLSSGVLRARLISLEQNIAHVTWSVAAPAPFWNTASYRIVENGECIQSGVVVQHASDGSLALSPQAGALSLGSSARERLIELDPHLEAPVLAAHLLLSIPLSNPLPALDVRLGTTRGTNALLTRGGAKVGLVTTLGFGDCLEIGEQNRPDLFALTIHKREPLTRVVLEADERLTADGKVLRPLDITTLAEPLTQWRQSGVTSLAICLLHAHVNDCHERMIAELAQQIGFENISVSSQVAPMIKLVARAETTVLDAYLTPVVADYVARLRSQFNRHATSTPTRLRLMTSAGNLVEADAFRGGDSILSGPAGGVVSLAKIGDAFAPQGVIGLDMGGTSTDVSRYAGTIPRDYESVKAGVRVLMPMMSIHTVAAGGGSICDVVEGRMTVGPRSAGASPGPACYGRGGPLTVTDLNVILGRLPSDRFPFPLDVAASRKRLAEANAKLGADRFANEEDAAAGFLTIAITHMAEAVRTVSTAQGSDPRDFALVGFGGAAGGHLCAIADALGMTRIIDHRDASLLSALGMGMADVGRIRTRGIYRTLNDITESEWTSSLQAVEAEATNALLQEANALDQPCLRFEADARYQGTEATLTLLAHPLETLTTRFHEAHRAAFGYDQSHRKIEVATIRCEATIRSPAMLDPKHTDTEIQCSEEVASVDNVVKTARVYVKDRYRDIPLHYRNELHPGDVIAGPAVVVDEQSTLVIDEDWSAVKNAAGSFELLLERKDTTRNDQSTSVDAVTVEVVARRMQGIADSMGELLRRTAASVNIRQRLDYSCAVFTRDGELIANAPHVPVHLGAMGHTVREIRKAYPSMSAGDVYVSNNPYAGGSHLPDVTVVTPVYCSEMDVSAQPDFYVASRAHHAEIGGKTPGSMPPNGTCLEEEGVVIDTFALRRSGIEYESELREMLSGGKYPSRDPDTNLADIAAQRAAGILGCNYLQRMVSEIGLTSINASVNALFQHAEDLVGRWIQTLPPVAMSFRDALDDGTVITVALRRKGDRLAIDFEGTAPVHSGCFNATPAIVTAATLYVLRCVVGGTLPMNDGIMRRIDLSLPVGLLNPPRGRDASLSPAVVAGNVETSMRIVDCLLGALNLVAASQGTMNNVLIGDSSFGYYETIGGGAGASAFGPGASGVHTHMTNTRITDPEVYEARYPVRLWRFQLRHHSGGAGLHFGGEGLVREIEFLRPLSLSLITNRRPPYQPWGLAGGAAGLSGENILIRAGGETSALPAATTTHVETGDRFIIKTPGGGGWGDASTKSP